MFTVSKKNFLISGGIVAVAATLMASFVLADVSGSLLPSSDGSYSQWTPKSGSTHYTMVDESSCNGTTDYNYTATVGSRDSYGVSLGSVPNGSTITAIEITPCASRNSSGGGSATMNVYYRYSGVDSSDAGNYALSGTTPVNLTSTVFSGLSLAKDSGSTLQAGAVLSAGTKGARLSRIAVKVTYTPPTPVAPTVTTSAATNVTSASSTLNGLANPNGTPTEGWFRYSSVDPGACDNVFGTRAPAGFNFSLGSGNSPVQYSIGVGSLLPATTYYYCAIASNTAGMAFGSIVPFTTLP